jgi:protein-L-isoaspartate(D-aspartate) O-methyltransferase
MGVTLGKGLIVAIERTAVGYSAEMLSFIAIYSAIGLRDPEMEARLGQAMRRIAFPNLARLRRDEHVSTEACWLHGPDFCLSMDPA